MVPPSVWSHRNAYVIDLGLRRYVMTAPTGVIRLLSRLPMCEIVGDRSSALMEVAYSALTLVSHGAPFSGSDSGKGLVPPGR